MADGPKVVRFAVHLALFLLALALFYLGLGMGLTVHPMYGNLLWLAALVVVGLNVVWIVRRSSRK